jgi:ABC-type antimicrobial peptide transport system permease subunit
LTILFSVLLGLVGAFLPVWRIRGLDPYALIQAHER